MKPFSFNATISKLAPQQDRKHCCRPFLRHAVADPFPRAIHITVHSFHFISNKYTNTTDDLKNTSLVKANENKNSHQLAASKTALFTMVLTANQPVISKPFCWFHKPLMVHKWVFYNGFDSKWFVSQIIAKHNFIFQRTSSLTLTSWLSKDR